MHSLAVAIDNIQVLHVMVRGDKFNIRHTIYQRHWLPDQKWAYSYHPVPEGFWERSNYFPRKTALVIWICQQIGIITSWMFMKCTNHLCSLLTTGKMCLCRVMNIARRRPPKDELDNANPVRNDETGLWQCPFCLQDDFPELSEVSLSS